MQRRGFLKSIFGVSAAVAVAPIAAMVSIKPEVAKPLVVSGGLEIKGITYEIGRGSAPTYFRDMPMPRGY